MRRLENHILRDLIGNRSIIDVSSYILVNISQFNGIEIDDFAVEIAKLGLWLQDHMMNQETAEEFGLSYVRLPLANAANIINGNALTLDWQSIIPSTELSYIFGNPPFQGARKMNATQKNETVATFNGLKSARNLDYVTSWYKKAAEYIQNTSISVAFVSTNSICQGEQVSVLWDELLENYHIDISFAYRTFKWSNEASGNAAVHCVIIGFSCFFTNKKMIYDGVTVTIAKNINPYLVDAPNTTVKSRSKPLCDVPKIGMGNQPIDGGYYLFDELSMNEFISKEPASKPWFRKWIGSQEFIYRYNRWYLYLEKCPPAELRKMPECMKRIEAVRQYRLSSDRLSTKKLAQYPTQFQTKNIPQTNCVVIPEVSSELRLYIPIGFVGPDYLCSNKLRLIPDATLFDFGILTSGVHMAWTKYVCGRLETRYSYSIDVVYNNFPWPETTERQKKNIEKAAQAVLDARNLYPTASLADLYDPLTMPAELVKAHNKLDQEVEKAYGKRFNSDAERVAFLFERYVELTTQEIE